MALHFFLQFLCSFLSSAWNITSCIFFKFCLLDINFLGCFSFTGQINPGSLALGVHCSDFLSFHWEIICYSDRFSFICDLLFFSCSFQYTFFVLYIQCFNYHMLWIFYFPVLSIWWSVELFVRYVFLFYKSCHGHGVSSQQWNTDQDRSWYQKAWYCYDRPDHATCWWNEDFGLWTRKTVELSRA